MPYNEEALWKIIISGFSAGGAILVLLSGWIWILWGKLHERVTYKWVEEQLQKEIKQEFALFNRTLIEIKNAIVGDFKEDGLMTRMKSSERNQNRFDKRLEDMTSKINDIKRKIEVNSE